MGPTEKRTTEDLIKRLKGLPLEEVPPNLTTRIMLDLEDRRAGFLSRFWDMVRQPLTISFQPLYAISLVLVVFGAFMLGRATREQVEPVHVSAAAPLEDLLADPPDAESVYLVGRGLLAAEKAEQAVPLLPKAALLEPTNPEYALWEGIGYWSTGDREREKKSYLRGLTASPDSVPLLTNLGHNYLSAGSYAEALDAYQSVLRLDSGQSVARYNSGLIFRQLKRTGEEIATWKAYLDLYRTGKRAYKAVDHLNRYGDYSYRTYQIGVRKVVISPDRLFNQTLPLESRIQELATVAEILERNQRLRIEVVVFVDNDMELARSRGLMIRDVLESITRADTAGRIGLSWFASVEPVNTGPEGLGLTEGLLLFGRDSREINGEATI